MTEENTPEAEEQKPVENFRSEIWAEKQVTDVSFAGFQFWAIIGVVLLGVVYTLVAGYNSTILTMISILFVGACCIGGCVIANKYGKKFGFVFVLLPIGILAAGLILGVGAVRFYQLEALEHIREGLLEAGDDTTIFELGYPPEGKTRSIQPYIAKADYLHADESVKESHNGYWYAMVKFDYDGTPFADIPGKFAICAFPEFYGSTGKHIYLMDAEGRLYRIELGAAKYIRTFPGPDPTEYGWEMYLGEDMVKVEDGGQEIEDGGRKAEDGGQEIEDGEQRTEESHQE